MTIFYRRLPRFTYKRPRSLEEAFAIMDALEPASHQVFSGGTDFIPKLKSRAFKAPSTVVDLKGIQDLDFITFKAGEGLRIGANAIVRDVARAPSVQSHYTALAQGSGLLASNQIQHRGTIVGNICNAVPSADSAPALLAHRAQVVCASPDGQRTVPLADFFVTAGKTVLRPRELVTDIRVPVPAAGERSIYLKLAPRGRMDLAIVGVAAAMVVEAGIVRSVTIGLGSAGPVPVRALRAEHSLLDQRLSGELIAHAASLAADSSKTRSSHRATAAYRSEMIGVLTRRALTQLGTESNA
jgi:carbon-monoxide dehydrogenase medium subunit